MNSETKFTFKKMIIPGTIMVAFWFLGLVLWQSSGYIEPIYKEQTTRFINRMTLCLTCTNVCPVGALNASFGFDIGGKELLNERKL